jgi:hypothetical protein
MKKLICLRFRDFILIPNACRHPGGRLYGILERFFLRRGKIRGIRGQELKKPRLISRADEKVGLVEFWLSPKPSVPGCEDLFEHITAERACRKAQNDKTAA